VREWIHDVKRRYALSVTIANRGRGGPGLRHEEKRVFKKKVMASRIRQLEEGSACCLWHGSNGTKEKGRGMSMISVNRIPLADGEWR